MDGVEEASRERKENEGKSEGVIDGEEEGMRGCIDREEESKE